MTKAIKVLLIGSILGFILEGAIQENTYALGRHGSSKIEPASDVFISQDGIAVPLERILLVKADTCYCAVKFTNAYAEEVQGKYSGEFFASYESWYQGDGTGGLSKLNVKFTKGDLSWKLPIGIGRLWLITRRREDIQCGSIILRWLAQTAVSLTPKKVDEKVENIYFAPTPWTSIQEVNVRDPRIVWYRQEPDRAQIRISIDHLWK